MGEEGLIFNSLFTGLGYGGKRVIYLIPYSLGWVMGYLFNSLFTGLGYGLIPYSLKVRLIVGKLLYFPTSCAFHTNKCPL